MTTIAYVPEMADTNSIEFKTADAIILNALSSARYFALPQITVASFGSNPPASFNRGVTTRTARVAEFFQLFSPRILFQITFKLL